MLKHLHSRLPKTPIHQSTDGFIRFCMAALALPEDLANRRFICEHVFRTMKTSQTRSLVSNPRSIL